MTTTALSAAAVPIPTAHETHQRSRPRHDRTLDMKLAPASATGYHAGGKAGDAGGAPLPTNADMLDRQAFFAAATHDLRAPLTSLTLWMDTLELLRPRLAGPADIEAAALLEQALRQMQTLVGRSVHLVDGILDVVRLKSGRPSPLSPGKVDLVDLASESVKGWSVRGNDVLHFESTASELWGWWDGDRLTRLVENLLDNAIKYSPAGGTITLRVASAEADGQEWAVLEVEDHGIGIPAAELSHVFEPFHRAHNVTPNIAGNGLGLWGCRTIVEQHGGRMAVASREGEGTTFTVHLPLRQPGPTAAIDLLCPRTST
jgi:signal transduction histidine kinase